MKLSFQLLILMQTVENMVEAMANDYCRAIEENEQLNEELENCVEVVRGNYDVITTLENELMKLKQHRYLVNSGDESAISSDSQIDFRHQFERLQQQLIEKDETIQQLLDEVENFKTQLTELEQNSHDTSCNEPDPYSTYTTEILNASTKLRNKINELGEISTDVETILNTNEDRLLEQLCKIDEVTSQLKSQIEQTSTKTNEESDAIQYEDPSNERMKENDGILARQVARLEAENAVLMDERQKLKETNINLLRSISLCQVQLRPHSLD